MQKLKGRKVLVVGAGNEMKGDDSIGFYVIERLKTRNKIFCGEMPENFVSKIKSFDPEVLLIVDAVDFQEKPGEVVFAGIRNLKAKTLTTHSISLSLMEKLLPGIEIFILGVQPQSLEFGAPISPKAREAADTIVKTLNELILY